MTSLFQRFKDSLRPVIDSALQSVNPSILMQKHISLFGNSLLIQNNRIDLSRFNRVHLIAAGKSAVPMTDWILSLMGNRIDRGLVISSSEHVFAHQGITSIRGDHPVPGKNSSECGARLSEYASTIGEEDLVIGLISGGSSAMILSPPEQLGPGEISRLNQALLSSGADILEINTIRKHLSTIKGGNLARKLFPATIVSAVISDVGDENMDIVGSGMLSGDHSTFEQALGILKKYSLTGIAGTTILKYLEDGASGIIPENPRPSDPEISGIITAVIGSTRDALLGAADEASAHGFATEILNFNDRGDVREASSRYAAFIHDRLNNGIPESKGRLFLFGGEFTVSLKGEGKGGRVQEFLLRLLLELKDSSGPYLAAGIGTDGIDGPTDVAGAWISHETHGKNPGFSRKIPEFLKRNDSYRYFNRTGQHIVTGPTGTNVRDIFLIFIP